MRVEDWLGEDNQLGIDIWNKKYRYENESFDEWLDRVSAKEPKIKEIILSKKFLFGGRILANRGLAKEGRKITYSNCYVVQSPEDNIESIYEVASKLARTYSYGGGCGVDISKLAPRGAKVNNAAKETSGAVSFMDTYSQVTEQIGQNGRRGALMISLDCHHPDLEEFIDVKRDLNRVTKANTSIRFTDDFMEAVENNTPFTLSFTRKETGETIEKIINAKNVFMRLAENNWRMAEPGCLFWDTIRRNNLLELIPEFEYESTNPCAEEPLPAGGSCLLGSLNLAAFVDERGFDFEDFANAVRIATLALIDVMLEGLDLHPLKEQRDSVNEWHQIGLGIMGLADMLIKMGIRYGSIEALAICDAIGGVMAREAMIASADAAEYLGPSFAHFDPEAVINSTFFKVNGTEKIADMIEHKGLYNSQLLTIAPTGSISTMLGISGGIEPIYANSYTRKTESLNGEDTYYKVYTPIVQEYLDENHCTEDDLPNYFVTAPELSYKERIDMQSVWQKHIDASISSTVNVPNDFSVVDTFNLYMYAWEKGLKGVTIYRDGCERTGILSKDEPKEESQSVISFEFERGEILPLSDETVGKMRHLMTGCGTLHCQAWFTEDGDMVEAYFPKGNGGGCERSMMGLSRMISLAARGGIPIERIIDQLKSVPPCPAYVRSKNRVSRGSSCPSAIAFALEDMIKEVKGYKKAPMIKPPEQQRKPKPASVTTSTKPTCPECGEPLFFEGGCNTCKNCGWTKCE